MLGYLRVVVGEGERALLYRARRPERVLGPGVTRIWDPLGNVDVHLHDLSVSEYKGSDAALWVEHLGITLTRHFVWADIRDGEVGLLYHDGELQSLLAPGTRRLYWSGSVRLERLPLPPGLDGRVDRRRAAANAPILQPALTLPRYGVVPNWRRGG